jgi:hypothetical protein
VAKNGTSGSHAIYEPDAIWDMDSCPQQKSASSDVMVPASNCISGVIGVRPSASAVGTAAGRGYGGSRARPA